MKKNIKDRPTRVLTISDTHCGNMVGLTPDKYNPQSEIDYRAYTYRRALWEWFEKEIEKIKPIDICVANGDLIDGKGPKSGGVEQIYQSRPKQIEIAIDVLKIVEAKEYHFTYGSGYHTGPEDDWERDVATKFNAGVEDVLSININGLLVRWRHHINTSQVPSGRATPLLRQQEWDSLWSLDGEFKRADVMVFSHVHYFQAHANRFGSVFTTPALQGLGGSQLGARRLGGIVDYGFLTFDITSKEDWIWTKHILKQTSNIRHGQNA